MPFDTVLFIIACCFGFFMAWGVGANDVANAMGTSVGSKALTLTQAVIVAAIFETAGTLLAGGEVTQTIRGEIINADVLVSSPHVVIYGMLAALLAAGIWLLSASRMGWPVSTTHSIIGALIGVGLVTAGPAAIRWGEVMRIGGSWVVTPIIAGIIAHLIFRTVQRFILNSEQPLKNAKRYVPIYIFTVASVVAWVTTSEGLEHLGINLSTMHNVMLTLGFALLVSGVGAIALHRVPADLSQDPRFDFKSVEKVFGILMIFTACAMAFAHGSNDVANAIGPLAAIVSILKTGVVKQQSGLPLWILLLGAGGIVSGLAMYGYRVIATIGERITHLTPSRGFAAELATASTVVIASGTGLPVSTTQTLVGAVLGVGLARGISALNLNVIRNILMSWVITLPAGAVLAIVFFQIINFIGQ